jgi:hypothetical protein
VAELGPGEFFGGLTTEGGIQKVGIRCVEEMIVLVLPQTEFEPLLMALPGARQKVYASEAVLTGKA